MRCSADKLLAFLLSLTLILPTILSVFPASVSAESASSSYETFFLLPYQKLRESHGALFIHNYLLIEPVGSLSEDDFPAASIALSKSGRYLYTRTGAYYYDVSKGFEEAGRLSGNAIYDVSGGFSKIYSPSSAGGHDRSYLESIIFWEEKGLIIEVHHATEPDQGILIVRDLNGHYISNTTIAPCEYHATWWDYSGDYLVVSTTDEDYSCAFTEVFRWNGTHLQIVKFYQQSGDSTTLSTYLGDAGVVRFIDSNTFVLASAFNPEIKVFDIGQRQISSDWTELVAAYSHSIAGEGVKTSPGSTAHKPILIDVLGGQYWIYARDDKIVIFSSNLGSRVAEFTVPYSGDYLYPQLWARTEVGNFTLIVQATRNFGLNPPKSGEKSILYVLKTTTKEILLNVTNIGLGAALSPNRDWLFHGEMLYAISLPDPQSGNPRVRFWGKMMVENLYDLSTPIMFEAPQQDWHAYFFGGRLSISKLITSSFPAHLIEDPDVENGRLWPMATKGLIKCETLYTEWAEPQFIDAPTSGTAVLKWFEKVGEPTDDWQHVVAHYNIIKFTPPPYFVTGKYIGVTEITIPLAKKPSIYSDISLDGSLVVVSTLMGYDKYARAGALAYPLPIIIGAGAGAGATALSYRTAYTAAVGESMELLEYGWKGGGASADEIAEAVEQGITKLMGARAGALKSAAKLGGRVGIAVSLLPLGEAVTVGGIPGFWDGLFGNIDPRVFVVVAPIISDAKGNKYTVLNLVLPANEFDKVSEYTNIVEKWAENKGLKDVGVKVTKLGSDWNEYEAVLQAGTNIAVDLDSLVSETIAAEHGLSLDELTIESVEVLTFTIIEAKETFFEWMFGLGGVDVGFATAVASHSLMVTGTLQGGEITNPIEIAELLSPVMINGEEYDLVAGTDSAYVDYFVPGGASRLAISFPKAHRGMSALIKIENQIVVKKDFEKVDDFGYIVDFHYNWKATQIRLDRIELVDMEYPMIYAERTFIYNYGNFTHDITNAFELANKTADSSSPSGYRYSYVTVKNTKYLDPANGAILQPCKHFIIRYFYKSVPDAIINVYLNGTEITSSKARHATVVIQSRNAEQDVGFVVYFRLKRLSGLQVEVLSESSDMATLHVEENGTAYKTYLIDDLVAEAVRIMKEEQTPVFLEVYAKITSAEYNYIKENDEATVVYYPPPPIIEEYGKNASLQVHVYNALNGSAIQGATVRLYNDTVSYEKTTNSTGWASFVIPAQLWNLLVQAEGYYNYSTKLYVYTNMTFNVALVPKSIPLPEGNGSVEIPPGVSPPLNNTNPPITVRVGNKTYYYWWLSVQVIYQDGAPFHGALVTIRNATDNSILFQKETNGTGFVHFLVPNGAQLIVEVNATNPNDPNQTFYESRMFTITHHTWLVFKLAWQSKYYEPEVMLVSLQVVIHRGQGYLWGNVSHLVLIGLWTNTPQNVTVLVELIDANTSQVINSETVNISLPEGLTMHMTWISVNATQGMYVKAHAKIISYENDTDLSNNELYSDVVFLKPYVDLQVFIVYKAIELKVPTAVLPEDIIEIAIGVKTPVALKPKPMRLAYDIFEMNLRNMTFRVLRGGLENVTTQAPGIIWRNFTIMVPWTSRLVVNATADHEWEDMAANNNASVTIWIDPDVKVQIKTKAIPVVVEGQTITLLVNVTSNVEEAQNKTGWLSVLDNSTDKVLFKQDIVLKPIRVYNVSFTAPENPTIFWIIRQPVAEHEIQARFAGWDLYQPNNVDTMTITVTSSTLLMILVIGGLIIGVIIAIMAVIKAGSQARSLYRKPRRVLSPIDEIRGATLMSQYHIMGPPPDAKHKRRRTLRELD